MDRDTELHADRPMTVAQLREWLLTQPADRVLAQVDVVPDGPPTSPPKLDWYNVIYTDTTYLMERSVWDAQFPNLSPVTVGFDVRTLFGKSVVYINHGDMEASELVDEAEQAHGSHEQEAIWFYEHAESIGHHE